MNGLLDFLEKNKAIIGLTSFVISISIVMSSVYIAKYIIEKADRDIDRIEERVTNYGYSIQSINTKINSIERRLSRLERNPQESESDE